jgi:ABC-type lipoprotein release transport system permease subunit
MVRYLVWLSVNSFIQGGANEHSMAGFALLRATDPLTFGVIALSPIIVALVSSWIPARRATKVDPMVALMWE